MSEQVLCLQRTMGLVKNFLTMNGLTLLSRFFGLIREILLLHFMGASVEMDAYTTAEGSLLKVVFNQFLYHITRIIYRIQSLKERSIFHPGYLL